MTRNIDKPTIKIEAQHVGTRTVTPTEARTAGPCCGCLTGSICDECLCHDAYRFIFRLPQQRTARAVAALLQPRR